MIMNPGELKYKNRRVEPATFKAVGKDLRRLVGKCSCGKVLRGEAAIPSSDSYSSEIYGDYTPIVQCAECEASSAEDI
jgi:hypothetical protein